MAAIDLRSDTVTRPSAAMRRAMAEAEVGDDVFLEDPTLNLLQERAAAVFGREAALFVPSGSMGNLTCVMAQTRPGQEVICETNGHIYNYEMGALSALAGVLPRVVNGEDGLLSWNAIAPAIRPKVYYRPQTSLICLENTVNMAGGTVYRTSLVEDICDRAHEQGIHVHLDGARVFNAATYLNEHVAEMTTKVRLGAVLPQQRAGRACGIDDRRQPRVHRALPADPEDARRRHATGRRARGGGPRRARRWTEASAGRSRQRAGARAASWRESRASRSIRRKVQTNIVIFSVKPSGLSSADFLSQIALRAECSPFPSMPTVCEW